MRRGTTMAEEEAADNYGSAKRMKLGDGELRSSISVQITPSDGLKNYTDSALEDLRNLSGDATTLIPGEVQASCCSSNGTVTEKSKSADLGAFCCWGAQIVQGN